jgi:hypothetical protein
VPPGEYEVVLVMRKLVDDQPVDEIIDRPLEKVTIVAGKDRELSLKAPDVGEEVRR